MVAASLLRERGLEVLLLEAGPTLGGGVRTKELTLPGYRHDVCSAVHPFGRSSPVLQSMDLSAHGLSWIDPEVPLAHPMIGAPAVILHRDTEQTALAIGPKGGDRYRCLMDRLCSLWPKVQDQLLGPPLRLPSVDRWLPLAQFGAVALTSASMLSRWLGPRGGALWSGLCGHSLLPMSAPASSAVAAVLGSQAHRVGWPFPRGGAEAISKALEAKLRSQGVEIQVNRHVGSLADLPKHKAVIFDLSARPLLELLGPALSSTRRRALGKFRLGPGVFKIDYALSGPVPWSDPDVKKAGTVHLGATTEEIAESENLVWQGKLGPRPFLLGVQPSLFDNTRAPEDRHTFWVYAHVPNGWTGDAVPLIENQIERFAPGFRDLVLGKHVLGTNDFAAYNTNYVGGDILGGANTLWQVLKRPFLSPDPYYLGDGYFCCSASVPPGGGIHGMGGFHAAASALKRFFA